MDERKFLMEKFFEKENLRWNWSNDFWNDTLFLIHTHTHTCDTNLKANLKWFIIIFLKILHSIHSVFFRLSAQLHHLVIQVELDKSKAKNGKYNVKKPQLFYNLTNKSKMNFLNFCRQSFYSFIHTSCVYQLDAFIVTLCERIHSFCEYKNSNSNQFELRQMKSDNILH